MSVDVSILANVTLAILAGGEGLRMGKPKALLEVGGRPILEYLLDQFAWPGPTLLVTAPGREKPPGADRFNREVTDAVSGEGPLRGVLTALEACETSLLFITTVDMPNVGVEQATWMIERVGEKDGTMCRRAGKIEPFPVVLRRSFVSEVERRLKSGERSVHGLADRLAILDVGWLDEVWTNLNRPEEFEAWRKRGPRLD